MPDNRFGVVLLTPTARALARSTHLAALTGQTCRIGRSGDQVPLLALNLDLDEEKQDDRIH